MQVRVVEVSAALVDPRSEQSPVADDRRAPNGVDDCRIVDAQVHARPKALELVEVVPDEVVPGSAMSRGLSVNS